MFPTEKILEENKLFFQYPVITEKTFFLQNKLDENFIGFPWATIIDKNIDHSLILSIINPYIEKNKEYYTCCQHIYFKKLLKLFSSLNIFLLYTPHKILKEDIIENITILPCPLYANNFENNDDNLTFQNVNFIEKERNFLYSFQGAYIE